MRLFNATIALLFFVLPMDATEIEYNVDINDTSALTAAIIKTVNQAYDLNMRGLDALEEKKYSDAMSFFDEALNLYPEYDDAMNNRGVVYFRQGLVSDAKRVWEALASSSPQYSIASYNLGLVCIHEKQFEMALRLFERALKSNKNLVEAWVRSGYLQMQEGKKEKGLDALRKAYKIAPDHKDAWSFLAHGLITTGDTVSALEIIKKKEPAAEALRMHGVIEAARKNYSAAAVLLSRAVDAGADPALLLDLANVQVDNNKCKDAMAALNKYFALNIHYDADAWLLAGVAAKDCGDINAAEKYFQDGIKQYPNDAIMKYNLGQIYFLKKKYDAAEETWNGLNDSLQDPSLLYMRAMNARQKGKIESAEKLVRKAIEIDERAEFYDLLGVLCHQKGDDKAAEKNFRKALKINSELQSAQVNLGLLTKSPEALAKSIKEYENLFADCKGDSCHDIVLRLSILYYHAKKIDKAINVLLTIKEIDRDEAICRHLAIYYKELQEWSKAIQILESASKRLLIEPQTEYELAETYLFAGYHTKAIEKLIGLVTRWTSNPWRLYYQIGYAYLEQNDLVKAKEYFDRSLKSKPGNLAARGLLAFVFNRLGNVDDARMLWEKTLKDDPSNVAIWVNMGLTFERDGKYSDALDYYKRASMIKENKDLQINIGNAYAGMGKTTEALDAYNQALQSSKRDLAVYNIFLIARKKKDKDRALSMITILKTEFPSSTLKIRAEAEMNFWDGDTSGAINKLEGIKEQDASDWITLASAYANRKNVEKANMYLNKVPNEIQWKKSVENVKAEIAFQSGDYDNALQTLKSISDTSFNSQYNIAITAYNAKRYSDALALSENLSGKSMGRDHADICRLAGNSAFALKDWKTAKKWYMDLSGVDRDNAIVQYNIAVACYNLNDIDGSWKYYQRAKELDTKISNKDIEGRFAAYSNNAASAVVMDSVDMWYNSAVDYQNNGQDTLAESLYKKVVGKDPGYNLAWNNLGALYGKRGDIDNAINSYMKAIEKKYDIPESYANLVNLYIELEEFSKAKIWIIKGLGHNPESQVLMEMKEKLAEAEKGKSSSK
jgi:tetratricopeptide (TPR) repeat protein